jgi:hypothetical protein
VLQGNISTDQKLGAENRYVSAKKPDAGGLSPTMDKEKEQIMFHRRKL